MRYLLIAALVLPLQGCWFFMFPIPTSLWEGGNACAGESVYVGQTLTHDDGRIGKVSKVIGRHQRCPTGARPMLVDMSFEEAK